MEINIKTINTKDKKVHFLLDTFDQKQINVSIDLDEYTKLNDVDVIDCAKIVYNQCQQHGSKFMCETAMDLEGVLIYVGYWENDGVIEVHGLRRLSEEEFNIFIQYRNEKSNLN